MSSRVDTTLDQLPEARVGPIPLRDAAREAVKQSARHDVAGLAAELAFRAVLAVLPFLLLVASLPAILGSVFDVPDMSDQISRQADTLLSKNSAEMVKTLVTEVGRSQGWGPGLLGLVGTLMAGISATSSTRKALNRLYMFEESKSFWERKLLELGLTLGVGLIVVAALLAVVMGPILLGGAGASTELVSLALAVLLMAVAVSLIYWLAPAKDNSFRWITPGAGFFILVWLLFSGGFSAYLSQFGSLNRVYGSLGAMLALLFWLYGSNFALLLGAELNAVVGRRMDPKVN